MRNTKDKDLRDEYDFASMAGGVRGKYSKNNREGTNIAVLAEDVAAAFPTDEAVNQALRGVMSAAEAMRPKPRKSAAKSTKARGSKASR